MHEPPVSVRVERSPKRIRALLDGEVVADSRDARLVWEHPHYPTYYLPVSDLRVELVESGREPSPVGGEARRYDVVGAHRIAPRAALLHPDSPVEELRDLVRLTWDAMDEWLEEDEPVYVHPRDPYKRVDILDSSRHVRVEVKGVTVAESRRPRILFETSLRPRYYLALSDVRTELLRPSATTTMCPYKGTATYWTVEIDGQRWADLVWTYRAPFAESLRIAGLVCFYDEKITLYLDGERQPNR